MKASSILILIFSLISFSLQGQTGFIDLRSEPSSATIYIDNISKGKTPKMIELNPGKHTLKLEYHGHEPSSVVVDVVEGMVLKENIKLRAYGKLSLTSNPSGSEVYIDNRKLKQLTPIANHFISAGNHVVKVISYGIEGLEDEGVSASRNVSIQSMKSRAVNINLYNELGAAKITSTPNAKTYINGKHFATTPHTYENLKKGVYNIRINAYLDDPYFEEFNIFREIKVSPKSTSILDIDFYKEFKLGTLSLKSSRIWNFEIVRLNSDYKKTITTSNRDYSLDSVQLTEGQFVLKWNDPGKNELTFNIYEDQHTYVFAPVKREMKRRVTLKDLPYYMSEFQYISKYHDNLPESKTVSRIGYSWKKGREGFTVATDYIGITLALGGFAATIVAAATENVNVLAGGAIAMAGGFSLAPFYKKEKSKSLKSNIHKNQLQKEDLIREYIPFRAKMEKDLKMRNDEILKINKRNSEFNESLPPAEVKYKSK